ncbi:MAG: AraC family transcriptional regulator [Bacteroidota bacterium]
MSFTTLLIKNMVCNRCVLAVEAILTKELIPFQNVTISQVRLCTGLSGDQRVRLVNSFKSIGFELIDNRNTALIERIKQLVITRARNEVNGYGHKLKLSNYIVQEVNHEYTYLSSLFSSVEGRTIEKYFIVQRIEKVKELLIYGQLTLSQIAFDLDYSSVAHLSSQFKSITGLTPTYFKEIGFAMRTSLDKI